jgi:hypothetical protein
MNLTLQKFDMRNISFRSSSTGKGPVIVLIGRRDTGKSFLVRDLLYYYQDIPVGTVISGTEEGNGFYGKMVPQMFIHNEYNSTIISNILQRQKKVMQTNQQQQAAAASSTGQPGGGIDTRCFVIMDDCLWDGKWTSDKMIRLMFMNGRHWGIMLIITMQYPLGIPPVLRTNIDYVFILREPYLANRRRIYENYAGMFNTFESFCQVMDQCTENYECLVINNNSKSNNLSDMIFWYKADKRPTDFKLGSKQYWELSNDFEHEASAASNLVGTRTRNGPTVSVKKTTK